MSNLFLYGLGFSCLLVFALLIWDAYIARRRMRKWAEDRKPPESLVSDDRGISGAVLMKRRMIFKPTFLMIIVATIMLVAMIKRHLSARDQHHAVNASLEYHSEDAGRVIFDSGDMLNSRASGDSWSFATALALSDSTQPQDVYNGNDVGWPDDFARITTDELSLKPEADFDSLATISLNLGLLTVENGGDITSVGNVDPGINCDSGMMTEMRLDCSLNNSLLSDSGNTKGLNTAVNFLP